MKLWHRLPQRLPVRVRPLHGETMLSYTRRLGHANALDSPTTILRAIGEPKPLLHLHLFHNFDARLNEPALRRLEILTGMPRDRLGRALPALRVLATEGRDDRLPIVRPYRLWNAVRPCQQCVGRLPGSPEIVINQMSYPWICKRHRRWVHVTQEQIDDREDRAHQSDLTDTPEIIAAHHKYARLRAAHNDNRWTYIQLETAMRITQAWARRPSSSPHLRRLPARWEIRGKALGPWGFQSPARVFPEAVILAEILTDLDWRRHLAIRPNYTRHAFFNHVGQRLGENPKNFSGSLLSSDIRHPNEPLTAWISGLRSTHHQARDDFTARRRLDHEAPLPESRHFK